MHTRLLIASLCVVVLTVHVGAQNRLCSAGFPAWPIWCVCGTERYANDITPVTYLGQFTNSAPNSNINSAPVIFSWQLITDRIFVESATSQAALHLTFYLNGNAVDFQTPTFNYGATFPLGPGTFNFNYTYDGEVWQNDPQNGDLFWWIFQFIDPFQNNLFCMRTGVVQY